MVKIIVIDDDRDQHDLFSDAAGEFTNIQIDLEKAINYKEAEEKLYSGEFDGAVVDLGLEKGRPKSAEGNDLLRKILDLKRFPVRVLTGNPNNISDQFEGRESEFFKVYSKDEKSSEEVLTDFVNIYNTGITKLLGGRGEIDTRLSKVFWTHLSRDLQPWLTASGGERESLLRYILNHLIEYLSLPSEAGKYTSGEFYIIPPIRSPMATGDILKMDGRLYVLLSPSCDITPRISKEGTNFYNVELVVLVEMIPLNKSEFDTKGILYSSKGVTNNSAWEKFCNNQRGTSPKQRYHYLPAYSVLEEALVDFKRIQNIPIMDVTEGNAVERIATISSPFISDIQSRFSAYFGRQGQPAGNWSN